MTKHNETLEALKRMSEEDPNGFSNDILALIDYKCKTAKAKAYKECIEKVEERLAVHSFTSNSTEYTDGMFDCMEWVDSKIEELKKELEGE